MGEILRVQQLHSGSPAVHERLSRWAAALRNRWPTNLALLLALALFAVLLIQKFVEIV